MHSTAQRLKAKLKSERAVLFYFVLVTGDTRVGISEKHYIKKKLPQENISRTLLT